MQKILAGIIIALLLCAGVAGAKELEDKKWRKATSANFEVYSRFSERKTIDLLRHLEVVRRILSTDQGSIADSPVPTLIVAVDSEREIIQLSGRNDFSGVFVRTIRRNNILMREVIGAEENHIILHEYAHFLMRNMSSMTYPIWYQEGYAELLGATLVDRKRVELFGFNEGRVYTLQAYPWLDAEVLLDPPPIRYMDEDEQLAFYAQSWLLVHFLASRGADDVTTTDGLKEYADLRTQGIGRVDAFEQAFELQAQSLNERLKRYIEDECCLVRRGSVDRFVSGFEPTVARADPAEVALALGRMSETFLQDEVAARFFDRASSGESTRGPALGGLARLSAIAGDFERAEEYLSAAIDAAPDDYEVLLDHAIWSTDGLMQDHSRTDLEASANMAFNAIEDAGFLTPEYYHARARLEMLVNDDYRQGVRLLLKAYQALPSDRQIQTDLAVALVNSGRDDAAKGVLRKIIAWSFEEPGLAQWARDQLEELDRLTED